MKSPKMKQGNLSSRNARSSTLGGHSRFVIINGLRAVSQISDDEIRAIETHFWDEVSQLFKSQKPSNGSRSDQNEAVSCEWEERV
jgi:hypothetical protein